MQSRNIRNIYVGGIRDSVYVPAVCAPSLASRPLAHSTSSSRISYTSFELASSVCLCRKPFLLLFLSFHISYVHICETLPMCVCVCVVLVDDSCNHLRQSYSTFSLDVTLASRVVWEASPRRHRSLLRACSNSVALVDERTRA